VLWTETMPLLLGSNCCVFCGTLRQAESDEESDQRPFSNGIAVAFVKFDIISGQVGSVSNCLGDDIACAVGLAERCVCSRAVQA